MAQSACPVGRASSIGAEAEAVPELGKIDSLSRNGDQCQTCLCQIWPEDFINLFGDILLTGSLSTVCLS